MRFQKAWLVQNSQLCKVSISTALGYCETLNARSITFQTGVLFRVEVPSHQFVMIYGNYSTICDYLKLIVISFVNCGETGVVKAKVWSHIHHYFDKASFFSALTISFLRIRTLRMTEFMRHHNDAQLGRHHSQPCSLFAQRVLLAAILQLLIRRHLVNDWDLKLTYLQF